MICFDSLDDKKQKIIKIEIIIEIKK